MRWKMTPGQYSVYYAYFKLSKKQSLYFITHSLAFEKNPYTMYVYIKDGKMGPTQIRHINNRLGLKMDEVKIKEIRKKNTKDKWVKHVDPTEIILI